MVVLPHKVQPRLTTVMIPRPNLAVLSPLLFVSSPCDFWTIRLVVVDSYSSLYGQNSDE